MSKRPERSAEKHQQEGSMTRASCRNFLIRVEERIGARGLGPAVETESGLDRDTERAGEFEREEYRRRQDRLSLGGARIPAPAAKKLESEGANEQRVWLRNGLGRLVERGARSDRGSR